jgi:AbrB family looped-hinge helix DNA binding protein
MHDKKLFGTATVGTKGQVVIPADAREAYNIKPGDRLYVVGSEKAGVVSFLKEDQLRAMVEHITDSIEQYRSVIDNTNK